MITGGSIDQVTVLAKAAVDYGLSVEATLADYRTVYPSDSRRLARSDPD
jgi:hypothetical protein